MGASKKVTRLQNSLKQSRTNIAIKHINERLELPVKMKPAINYKPYNSCKTVKLTMDMLNHRVMDLRMYTTVSCLSCVLTTSWDNH